MIGTRLGNYEITAHLGSGGFGDVYQATDSKLGRSVAIKLLPEAFGRDTEREARFRGHQTRKCAPRRRVNRRYGGGNVNLTASPPEGA